MNPATNQITTPGYAYDLNGNMTNDGLNTITYDAENRVVSSSGAPGTGAYVYDGNGLRVEKCLPNCTGTNPTTVYIYSGHQVIAAYDNGAVPTAPSREYILAGGTRLAKIASGATVYYHRDQVSVRVTTDSNGNVVSQQGHYPFGENWYQSGATPNSTPPNPLPTDQQFTTYQRDFESGNDYALAREFVSRLGRFSSLDPLSGNTADPQSLNRYSYVENDPIDLLDPEGEYICITGCGVDRNPSGFGWNEFDELDLMGEILAGEIAYPGCPYDDCSPMQRLQIANSIASTLIGMQNIGGDPTGGGDSVPDAEVSIYNDRDPNSLAKSLLQKDDCANFIRDLVEKATSIAAGGSMDTPSAMYTFEMAGMNPVILPATIAVTTYTDLGNQNPIDGPNLQRIADTAPGSRAVNLYAGYYAESPLGQAQTRIHEAIHDAYGLTDQQLAQAVNGQIYPDTGLGTAQASAVWNSVLQSHCH